MDQQYSELKAKLSALKSDVDAAISICDGMGGEENSESDSGSPSPSSGSGYSGGGGDNKIKAAVAKIRMGKA